MGGQLKSGEDMVDFWAELLERYPCIIGLIDPMRKQVLTLHGISFMFDQGFIFEIFVDVSNSVQL